MKHKRLLGYGGLGLTLIALGVAFVKPISTSNLLIRARADMGNLSVTFSRGTCTNSKGSYNNTDYVLTTSLQQSGLSVQASLTNGYAITSGQDVVRFEGKSSTLVFSIPSNGAGVTNFRKIKSVSFTYNSSYNVGSNYFDVVFSASSDFSSPDTVNVENDSSAAATISNAHYVKMIGDKTHYAYFASITIHYSCSDEPEVKTLSSISVSGQTTEFTVGDTFSFGGTVTAHYSDSTTADVTASALFSGYNMSQTGAQTVSVSYTEDEVEKTTTYSINVSDSPSENPLETLLKSKEYVLTVTSGVTVYMATFNFNNGTLSVDRWSTYSPDTVYNYTQTFSFSTIGDTAISFDSITDPDPYVSTLVLRLHSSSTGTATIANNSITALSITIYKPDGTGVKTLTLVS